MTRPGEFLFVTWPGGGNVNPVLALARRLLQRGHAVRVLGPRKGLGQRFAAEGIAYRAHRSGTEWTHGNPIRWPQPPSEAQSMAYLRGLAEDVTTELRREPPDVLVVDYMQPAALCAAEQSGLPFAAFVHTLYQRVALGERSPMQMAASVPGIQTLRGELGLSGIGRLPELLDRATRVLVVTARELDRPELPLPANVRYVGPVVEEAGGDAGWSWPRSGDDAPLALVSMSTTPMDEAPVIERVLEALAGTPLRVLVTLGDHLDSARFAAPPNAVIVRYLRHAAVLPHAQLMVTHAGLSSLGAALSHGVPLLCLPLGREQPDNAEHVRAAGAGLVLSKDADVASLRAAAMELLEEPRYRDAARGLAGAIEAGGKGWAAVDELERMLER